MEAGVHMSDKNLGRRTRVEAAFDGINVTKSIAPYLLSAVYTESEEDKADDIQLRLQDRDAIWLEKWLTDAINAASSGTLKMDIAFLRENWNWANGKDDLLMCGLFELDTVKASGPPGVITLKGTSLPYSATIRQTLNSRAWESCTLSSIVREIAAANGMTVMYESAEDPLYKRIEQVKIPDIEFLSQLCHNAGISLKVTNNIIVLFDQVQYEAGTPVLTIKRGDGSYTKWDLGVGSTDVKYASCRVRYTDPSGKLITATAYADEKTKKGQQLEISEKVLNAAEAKALAQKQLRLHNKFAKTVTFELPGNPAILSGLTVVLERWGAWDGKYIIAETQHSVSGSGGYTTQARLRKVLEGY